MGDVLKRIVDDDGEVIGDADVFASEDGIAVGVGVHAGFSEAEIFESELAMEFGGFVRIESPSMGFAVGDTLRGLFFGKIATGAGVDVFCGAVRCAETLLDVLTSAEARIDEVLLFQNFQGVAVGVLSAALAEGFAIPIESEPAEIFLDLLVIGFANA